MDSVFVPPAAAATNGFITHDSHGDHGHHGHGQYHDRDWERTAERVRGEVTASERARNEEIRDVLGSVERNGAAGSLATEKVGAAGILATNVASGALGVSIQATAAATNLAIEKTAAATNLAIEVGKAATNLAIEKIGAAQLLQSVKDAAAAQLYAAQNHAAALAQAAQCCCEVKEAISADGQKTRELINQNERERMQARIVALERLLPTSI
jgi:hypothetical protein